MPFDRFMSLNRASHDQPEIPTLRTLAFATREAAVHAYQELRALGVSAGDMSLFGHAELACERDRESAIDRDADVDGRERASAASLARGMGILLAGLGLLAGGISGLFAGIGLLDIPAFGPPLAAGPIAGALIGTVAGAMLGMFAGSLVDAALAGTSALSKESPPAAGRAIIIMSGNVWTDRIKAATLGLPALIDVDDVKPVH